MDHDIIVIGGGPAGLSAAARATWLAAPEAHYRARVLLLDAGDQPGGLSRWQPLVVNSPGVFFNKRERGALLQTCEHFGVEIRQEQVVSLREAPQGGFEVRTGAASYRTLAAIVATGCRLGLPGEARLFHRRRILWFHNNASLDDLVAQLRDDESISRLCLYGAEGVVDTRRYLGEAAGLELDTWAEPPYTRALPPEVRPGRLTRIDVTREPVGLALRFENVEDAPVTVAADVMLVDFNAYEATATSTHFLPDSVPRQAGAFLDPQRSTMAVGVAGLFSAGDVNGAPFCVAKAMSDGTVAGYSAYDYVCRARTGTAPNLFPYYPYEI